MSRWLSPLLSELFVVSRWLKTLNSSVLDSVSDSDSMFSSLSHKLFQIRWIKIFSLVLFPGSEPRIVQSDVQRRRSCRWNLFRTWTWMKIVLTPLIIIFLFLMNEWLFHATVNIIVMKIFSVFMCKNFLFDSK